MEQKMRIQLYDPDFNQIGDRLVTQGPEFAKGPKEEHKGPMKIEFSLFIQEDVEACIEYLRQLTGDLPLSTPKKKRGRKSLKTDSPNARAILTTEIGLNAEEGIANLTSYLESENFVVTSLDFLEDLGNPIAIKRSTRKRYIWFVRLVRKAKNPLNNRYDTSLLVGVKEDHLRIVSGDSDLLSKKVDLRGTDLNKVPASIKTKFPTSMLPEERAQFRVIMQQLKSNPELKPPRLYTRWLSEVVRTSDPSITFPKADEIMDLFEKGKTVQVIQDSLKAQDETTA